MSSYVVHDDNGYKIIDFRYIERGENIVAEVVGDIDADDPLLWPKNSCASPHDLFWPLNMFAPPAVRLSELHELGEARDRMIKKNKQTIVVKSNSCMDRLLRVGCLVVIIGGALALALWVVILR